MEVEQVHQIANRRGVQRDVWVVLAGDWVGQIVAAAIAYRGQVPVGFDEFQDRDVIGIGVRDVSGLGVFGDYQDWNSGSVAVVVECLYVSGVVVTSALVEGDDDGSAVPEFFVGLNAVDDFLYEALE